MTKKPTTTDRMAEAMERQADALESLAELFANYLTYLITRQQIEDGKIKKGAEIEADLLDL